MTKRNWVSFCLLSVLVISLVSGCGREAPETKVEVLEPTARESRLEQFDNQLASIKDEETAKTALTTFANYVEGGAAVSGVSASTVRIFSTSLIDRLAKLEAEARQRIAGGVNISSLASEEGVITAEKVTAALNTAKDPSIPEIKTSDIEFIQAGIRSELPNIVPASSTGSLNAMSENSNPSPASPLITPIEALVIGYVAASGDDGSGDPGAFKDNLPSDKVNTFINKATE